MTDVTIRLVTDEDLPKVDRDQMLAALLAWRAEGVESPMIPTDVDVDGDGVADAYALSAQGELVFISGAPLDATVFAATGGGVEAPNEESA